MLARVLVEQFRPYAGNGKDAYGHQVLTVFRGQRSAKRLKVVPVSGISPLSRNRNFSVNTWSSSIGRRLVPGAPATY